jgi:U2 small nuclear ribonucleoprotein A'
VSNNRLRTLDFLDGLPFLLHLNASRNLLTSVMTFASPRQLETVDLSHNLLGEIGSWDVHRYLKRLVLRSNFLEFLGSGLQACQHLRILDVAGNCLQEVEGVSHLPLFELYLGGNQLTSIAGLRGLRNLRILDLANNQLRTLEEMSASEHPALIKLDVRGNLLAHRKRIEPLEHCPYLADLYVSPNPVDQLPYYRLQMLKRMPQLRNLDDAPATAEEKVKAAVLYGAEVDEQKRIFDSVLPREQFVDRRFVTAEDVEEMEQKQFGQVGGYLDDVGDTTELYA